MNARELIAWGDREEQRRRAARRGLARLPAAALAAGGGLLLAAELARRIAGAGGDLGGASRLWVAVLIGGCVVAVFAAPFRFYWRRDAALLGRLALPGRSLYRAAWARCARDAACAVAPAIVAAAAFVPWSAAAALRHLALAGAGAAIAGLLSPAATLLAGMTVASDRAQAALSSFAEGGAPRTIWLGTLPGAVAAAAALVAIAGASWAAHGGLTAIGSPALLLGGAAAASIVAALAADAAAGAMTAALREVAALDQERLAHIDLHGPSVLERGWSRLLLRGRARLVFAKDAVLARRRYPIPYFVGAVGAVVLWIAAAFGGVDGGWAVATVGGLAAYTVLMARRLAVPPVEQPRLLATLPVGAGEAAGAKRAAVLLRALVTLVIAAAALVAGAADRGQAAVTAGAIVAAALGAGLLVTRADGPT